MTDDPRTPHLEPSQEPHLASALEESEPLLATPESAAEGEPPLAQEQPEVAGAARVILKRSGSETEHVFPINPPAVLGRFDASVGPVDVDLGSLPEGSYVSRKHAKITCEDGVWSIQDLGSSNGTFVLHQDFERVEAAELTDGQEFALGNARFVFKLEG